MTSLSTVPGVIDVHAHWLPEKLYSMPPGSPVPPMHVVDGQLYLGELPLSIAAEAMSDLASIVADSDAADIGTRILSAPPFAFPIGCGGEADEYIGNFNDLLAEVARDSAGRFLGLGLVRLDDIDAIRVTMSELAGSKGMVGVAVPPLVDGASYDRGVLRDLLRAAVEFDLAVLVHPMQLFRPEWSSYYMTNLVGNPVESATAIGSVVLGGVIDELPDLRICFVHGAGCAPALLGRWDHGWDERADVSAATGTRPSQAFRSLFADTLSHDDDALTLLRAKADPGRLVCGSDYPFDMAEKQPVRVAIKNGLDADMLEANARRFIGL
ncbi:MAG: amidohydrolase [Nocardioidaceae bacterium]|nr:MAG: amidohydrolase [Nocardioidaceae bacterium]